MHCVIVRAITEHRLLGVYYEPGARIIEPCAYGLSREHHGLLRAFQTADASASGKHVNWKLLRTDKITQIHILAEQFDRPRPEYRRMRVWDGYHAIITACRNAWNFLINDPDRIRSIAHRDWACVSV